MRIDTVGVHGEAAVDGRDDTLDIETAIRNRHLDRVRCIAAERKVRGEPDASSLRQPLTVLDALGDEAEQSCKPAGVECWPAVAGVFDLSRFAEKFQPELQRVLPGLVRDLVDKALYHEGVSGVCRRTPGAAWQPDCVMEVLHTNVVDDATRKIIEIQLRLVQILVRHFRAPIVLTAACKALRPGRDLAIGVNAGVHFVQSAGTIEVILYVVFARPLQLDRPAGLLRDHGRFGDVVVRQAPPEATTDARHFNMNVLSRYAGDGMSRPRRTRRHLRRRDDVALVGLYVGIAILRLERRMRDEGYSILARNRRLRCRHRGIKITFVQYDLTIALQHLFVLAPESFAAVRSVRALLPLDVERGSSLHRSPRRGRNYRNAAR